MNESYFYARIRDSICGGRLSTSQKDGIDKILAYRTTHYDIPDSQLAYILATVYHETGHTFQPVKEQGSEAYLKSKLYYPYTGAGLVQLTWKKNYDKFGIKTPEQLLQWPTSLYVLFAGMTEGTFTGKKLSDYIQSDASLDDFVKARAIINGTDKATMIAHYALAIYEAMTQANQPSPANTSIVDGSDQTTSTPVMNNKPLISTAIVGAGGVISTISHVQNQINDSLQQTQDGLNLFKGIVSMSPWILLTAAIGFLSYFVVRDLYYKSKNSGV